MKLRQQGIFLIGFIIFGTTYCVFVYQSKHPGIDFTCNGYDTGIYNKIDQFCYDRQNITATQEQLNDVICVGENKRQCEDDLISKRTEVGMEKEYLKKVFNDLQK